MTEDYKKGWNDLMRTAVKMDYFARSYYFEHTYGVISGLNIQWGRPRVMYETNGILDAIRFAERTGKLDLK